MHAGPAPPTAWNFGAKSRIAVTADGGPVGPGIADGLGGVIGWTWGVGGVTADASGR